MGFYIPKMMIKRDIFYHFLIRIQADQTHPVNVRSCLCMLQQNFSKTFSLPRWVNRDTENEDFHFERLQKDKTPSDVIFGDQPSFKPG
jgi:hypothetical protein